MIHGKIAERAARRFQILDEPCRLRILQALQGNATTVAGDCKSAEGFCRATQVGVPVFQ
jgi:hypothetical protein